MPETAPVSLTSISYIILFSKDVEKAAAFYRDKLGIPVRFFDKHWTELEVNGVTLALHHSDEEVPFHHPALPDVVFSTEDIRATHAALKAAGVKIHELKKVHATGDVVGVSAEFHDPDGNRLSVYGTVPQAEWKEKG